MRHLPRLTILAVTLLTWFNPDRASAETITVNGPTDIWFVFEEPSVFTVRTFAWQNGIDSMLWLYDDQGTLVAFNDDFYGLDSHLEVSVGAGSYRLRTGVCCWNPDAWYGTGYTIETGNNPAEPPTTTTEPATTTTSTTSTTTTEPSTTTSTTTSTVPETTTTSEVTTWPPTLPSTTSTSTVPPISEPSTTSSVPDTAPPPSAPATTAPAPVAPTTSTSNPPPSPASTTPPTTETPADPSNSPSDSLPAPDPTDAPSEPSQPVLDEITADEAATLASDPETLLEATAEEATQIFDSINQSDLTDEQAQAIVQAVQNAPTEIRAAFENELNVFDGQFDTYVPLGSTVDVGTRRTVTAGTVTMGVIAITPNRRKP